MLKATRRVSYNNEGASYLCSNENYKYLTPPYVTKNPLSPPVNEKNPAKTQEEPKSERSSPRPLAAKRLRQPLLHVLRERRNKQTGDGAHGNARPTLGLSLRWRHYSLSCWHTKSSINTVEDEWDKESDCSSQAVAIRTRCLDTQASSPSRRLALNGDEHFWKRLPLLAGAKNKHLWHTHPNPINKHLVWLAESARFYTSIITFIANSVLMATHKVRLQSFRNWFVIQMGHPNSIIILNHTLTTDTKNKVKKS